MAKPKAKPEKNPQARPGSRSFAPSRTKDGETDDAPPKPHPPATGEPGAPTVPKGTKRGKSQPRSKRQATKKPAPAAVTLGRLADDYLAHLEKIGKSPSTVFSYRMDLAIARTHFGEETAIKDLTTDQVQAFFESPAVTQKKGGKPKTEVTIKKTRRVLRMALVWAADKGLIGAAPIPAPPKTNG